MTDKPRLYHDFMDQLPGPTDAMASAPLRCRGTLDDIEKLGLELSEGMQVLLYQEDADEDGKPDCLEVDATVRFDPKEKCWVADFVSDELMYASERQRRGDS